MASKATNAQNRWWLHKWRVWCAGEPIPTKLHCKEKESRWATWTGDGVQRRVEWFEFSWLSHSFASMDIFFLLFFLCVHVCVVFCALCIFDISLQLLEIHNLTLIPRLFKHIYMQVVQMPTWTHTFALFASHLARNGANSTHLNSMSDRKTVYKTGLGNSLTTETSKYARILWMAEKNKKKNKKFHQAIRVD